MRIILISFMLISGFHVFSQQFKLPTIWKFATGDSAVWSAFNYDDSHWQEIEIGRTWQQNGIKHEGFAWYRLTVVVVDKIKASVEENGEAILNIGMIDDCDSTYFNGKLIGGRGFMPPEFESAWGAYRQYEIPLELINWNGSNTIAIKVFSPDTVGGGISDGPFWIGVPQKKIWYSEIPDDCPFEKSTDIKNIVLTGKFSKYTRADTWYPSWADNGNMYSGYTDGPVNNVRSRSGKSENATTGQAVIKGDNPMNLEIRTLGVDTASSLPFQGRYPSAYLCHNNVVYIGTYLLDDSNKTL